MGQKTICRAVLPKAGLGNRLFPWARCKVFSKRHDVPMVDTFFPQFSVGPWLRKETDPRIYSDLFTFRQGGIPLYRLPYYYATYAEVPEPTELDSPRTEIGDNKLVTFRGLGNLFDPLNKHHELIYSELLSITHARWKKSAEASRPVICMHVRLGDFAVPTSPTDYSTKGAIRTGFDWFIAALEAVRQSLGKDTPALVISNGWPDQLTELLQLPNVKYLDSSNAIETLLIMSRAKVLIGSGGSSYCAWATFLGRMPTITVPGADLAWFKLRVPETFVGVYDPAKPDPRFAQALSSLNHHKIAHSL